MTAPPIRYVDGASKLPKTTPRLRHNSFPLLYRIDAQHLAEALVPGSTLQLATSSEHASRSGASHLLAGRYLDATILQESVDSDFNHVVVGELSHGCFDFHTGIYERLFSKNLHIVRSTSSA